jgi:hypothetical protein
MRIRSDSVSLSLVKLRLVIEFDPEVQRWSAVFPELPGCASAGDTEEEAIANAKEALAFGLSCGRAAAARRQSA